MKLYHLMGQTNIQSLLVIYNQLDLSKFFDGIIKDKKIKFNFNLINRFIIFNRILFQESEMNPQERLAGYYEKPHFDY